MNEITIVAVATIGVGLLIAALSLPLVLRKVPMNHFYGVRFRASFASEQNWYSINESGGKALLVSSVPILLCGLYGIIFQPAADSIYLWLDFAVTMLSLFGAVAFSAWKARTVGTP